MSKKYLQIIALAAIVFGVIGGTGSFAEYCPDTKGEEGKKCCKNWEEMCNEGCKKHNLPDCEKKCKQIVTDCNRDIGSR